MSAYYELTNTGRLGPKGALLLYRAVRAVAVARNFPPPEGYSTWSEDAVTEVAHDFLNGDRARKRLTDLALRATDENSFENLLHKAVLNFHRDRSRRTDMGAFVRRIREILDTSGSFVHVGQDRAHWRLPDGPTEPSRTPPAVLAAAAAAEPDVNIPRWASTRRRAPLADLPTLERLIRRVLRAANGSLTAAEIAYAIAARLDPARVPLTTELDVIERVADPSPAHSPEGVLSTLRADELFESLSDRERILIATWERPIRDLGEVLGVRHSQAAVLKQRLAAALRDWLAEDDDPEGVIGELRALATKWLGERTTSADATFSKSHNPTKGARRG